MSSTTSREPHKTLSRSPVACIVATLLLAACASGDRVPPIAGTYAFDADSVGGSPAGLSLHDTGEGGPARWVVVADATAPSGAQVLEQQDANGENPRYAIALADAPVARDVRVAVRMMPMTGDLDRSGGLVFRATGPNDYYVVRANLLEKDVGLYRVVGGERTRIDAWERRLAFRRWHLMEVEARGDRIIVRWNGEQILDVRDETHLAPGRCGLWTKADAVTRFDDLRIESLD